MKKSLLITAVSSFIFLVVTWGSGMPGIDKPEKANPAVLARGKLIFNDVCATCHGKDGKGDGPLAANLQTLPRDFTEGIFKDRSTASGELPTDYDLFKVVTNGIHNTAMPPFNTLSPQDRFAAIQYVKTFSDRFDKANEYPLDIVQITTPIPESPESIMKGRKVYLKVQCYNCHGASGEGDGPSAATLKDEWGNKILPVDLTDPSGYKFAVSRLDVYRIFSTGLNGTPMPSFQDVLSDSDRWNLANYVWSLRHENQFEDAITIQELKNDEVK